MNRMNQSHVIDELAPGTRGELHYRARDIGYGIEEDCGEYVYVGIDAGKHRFAPKPKGDDIWLFEDEIIHWEHLPAGAIVRTYTVLVEEKVSVAYYVEASSPEDAERVYQDGGAFDYDRETIDSHLVSVDVT